ncbi:putative heparan sulfate 2-O-sulfotransferase pipe [Penaeus vannamei]|uniref:Putative heparan sulfate 2-O-sulfotransferase pipe n=1 Tax=Penaeus vannamei TaxID=6689 RepID=A0A423U4K4_PENVA|nr:putative heparan sulfate 2-O-sulfotransferase pipe [Penaeus vannamei]
MKTRRREGSMVKVKRLLILLNVGMAFLCLTALAILKERVTSSSHSRELVEYHVPLREDLVALRPQVSSTRPISLRKIGNPATLPQPSERDSASLSQPQDSAMFSEFLRVQLVPTSSLKPRASAMLLQSDAQDPVPPWQPYTGMMSRKNPVLILGRQGEIQEQPMDQGCSNKLVLRPVYPRIVIYNRVPKCASATMLRICRSLSQKNEFTFNNMKETGKNHKERAQQRKLANWIFNRSFHGRHFFFKHIPYLNFSRLGYWEPSWINIVRHPVKRLISHYYFKKPLQTLDVCIDTGVCKFQQGKEKIISQISYFCGFSTQCRSNLTSQTFQVAKQVVERAFVVVGLQEDLQSTLLVLEHLIPNFFSGASNLNYENWNIQTSKPPTSNRTLAALERRLKVDIEFYHYLQQRFYKQLEEVKGHYRGLKM